MIVSAMDPIQALSAFRIGAVNELENAGITASSTASGFDPYAVVDGRSSTYWKPAAGAAQHTLTFALPTAVYVDFFAVYSTDLAANRCSVQLLWSNDGVTYTKCADAMSPGGTAPMMVNFPKVFAAYFQVIVYANGATPSLGVVSAGVAFRPEVGMCVGFVPPTLGGKPIIITQNSMAGAWLGRALRSRTPYEGSMSFDYIPPARARTFWKPLMERFSKKPFFLQWHSTAFPYEIAYCWTTDADMVASYSKPNFMSASVNFIGQVS